MNLIDLGTFSPAQISNLEREKGKEQSLMAR